MRYGLLLVLSAVGTTSPITAQDHRPADKSAAIDALQQIRLGERGSAWHLTADVQLFQEQRFSGNGTVDLLHGPHGDWRVVYAFPGFHQTASSTSPGRVLGDAGDDPAGFAELLSFLLKPMDPGLQRATLKETDARLGKTPVHCFAKRLANFREQLMVCASTGDSSLRYVRSEKAWGSLGIAFDGFTSFEGSEVPMHVMLQLGSIPISRMTLHFDLLSSEEAEDLIDAEREVTTRGARAPSAARNAKISKSPAASELVRRNAVQEGTTMLRLQLGENGKVMRDDLLATTSDRRFARTLQAGLIGKRVGPSFSTSGDRFINVTYTFVRKLKSPDGDDFVSDPWAMSEGTHDPYLGPNPYGTP